MVMVGFYLFIYFYKSEFRWFGCGYGSGWLWLGWVGGCDVGVVGLWFGFGRKFQFVEIMGDNGGYRLGSGYWFAGFVGLFTVVLPSKKEREIGKERDGRKEKE